MTVAIVFETHSLTADNEAGIATGWQPGVLSEQGRALAVELGIRRRDDGLAAVFASDLHRAAQTADVAFGTSGLPVLLDWRLRECDYGAANGGPSAEMLAGRAEHITRPYPGGESWTQAVARVAGIFPDLAARYDGKRVLLIGHVATRWALDVQLAGRSLEHLVTEEFGWQEGWEYRLT